ncbi:glucosaminidase domain-containing protein [Companilactobacillus ginsenosidimutans]|uniref:Mannosyl-glycoprotein endo-beta-N-acetylglucosamidase-like domain-containing protein n=1 Tax=Companilactobacillus ginsenosidimutans TaxID=1007676 RepID=A0A0H4QH21_9LACO|nr:glucosaminidase domain-containing protein [Companilactobacillus ginsenosidimutans]AKP67709.1 hypothetical protein ABM34_09345 [Companilactobacillus ginsenosidimutans]
MNKRTKIKVGYTSFAIASVLLTMQISQTAHADTTSASTDQTPAVTNTASPASSQSTTTTSKTSSSSSVATTTVAPTTSGTSTDSSTAATTSSAKTAGSTTPTSTGSTTSPTQASPSSYQVTDTSSISQAAIDASIAQAGKANFYSDIKATTTMPVTSRASLSRSVTPEYSGSFQNNFLQEIKPYALAEWKEFKILPSLAAAQACDESYYGTELTGTYNYFGIKGEGTVSPTEEWNGSSLYETTQDFANFSSMPNGFIGYGEFMTAGPRYDNVIGNTNWYSAAEDVSADGWAGGPGYGAALISIIEEYGLDAWDKEAFNEFDFPQAPQNTGAVTVEFVPGYGVNAYNRAGYYVDKSRDVFMTGTSWKTWGSTVINGQEMFAVAPDEFLPMEYTNANDNYDVTINAFSGKGVTAYRANGTKVYGSESTFKTGTSWKIGGVDEINGAVMYAVGSDEYVPREDTQYGGIITISCTPGEGTDAYDSTGKVVPHSNWTFLSGTQWKVDRTQIINGQLMYRVSTDEYIPQGSTEYYAD